MKRALAAAILLAVFPVRAWAADAPARVATDPGRVLADLLADKHGELSHAAEQLLGKNGGDRLFYFPTRDAPHDPAREGLKYENVSFASKDGTRLRGWFLPAAGRRVKGTVVFSHGNAGAMGYHLGFVDWLVPRGFNVLLYDYRGFGLSDGDVGRRGMIDDVHAAFDYVRTRRDVDGGRLISMAHSLGGAQSITALGERPVRGLRAVITEGAFASYQQMARVIAGNVGGNLVSDDWSPMDWVAKISPVPLLLVHGTDDRVVPISQSRQLFAAAKQPKRIFEVQGGSHGDSLARNGGEYRKKMLDWLDQVMR
jgi:fermentation-respiration switch protein FrsA (DUF1100 family)